MTQIAILSDVKISKPYIADTSQSIIAAIQNGEVNPLELKLQVKAMESVFETVKPILDKAARAEAETFGTNTFEKSGCEIKLVEAGTKYDFDFCNDPVYSELLRSLDERKKYLKALPKDGATVVNETTGEIYKIMPPIKKSTSTISISIK